VKSEAEILFAKHLEELGVRFERETPVCAGRKWRLDFTLAKWSVAVEIDGYFRGRHGAGWGADNEKRNTATMMGWRVLTFSTNEVKDGRAIAFLKEHVL